MKTPGTRYISSGKFSGEDFRDNFLVPRLNVCLSNNERLFIDLDGGYGYASCFLEEVFGGLIRKDYKLLDLMKCIEIISKEELRFVNDIKEYIIDAHMIQRDEIVRKSLIKR